MAAAMAAAEQNRCEILSSRPFVLRDTQKRKRQAAATNQQKEPNKATNVGRGWVGGCKAHRG